jgi:hypothetical protein
VVVLAAKKSPPPRSARPAKKASPPKAATAKKEPATKRAASASRPVPPPSPGGLGSVVDQMGPRLRAEFEVLQRSEAKILRALRDPSRARAFAADPLGTLTTIGVAVPPIIKQRLKASAISGDLPTLAAAQGFRLPNGQVVTANVNIRFTGSSRG